MLIKGDSWVLAEVCTEQRVVSVCMLTSEHLHRKADDQAMLSCTQ